MEHLAQSLGTALVEGGVDPLGSGRALAQRLFDAPLVEALYGCARRLGIAAQRAGYGVGVLAPGAGKEDLATTEDEGVGRAQAVLQDLALGVRKRTHEDRSSHGDQRSTLQTTCSENALGGQSARGLPREVASVDAQYTQDQVHEVAPQVEVDETGQHVGDEEAYTQYQVDDPEHPGVEHRRSSVATAKASVGSEGAREEVQPDLDGLVDAQKAGDSELDHPQDPNHKQHGTYDPAIKSDHIQIHLPSSTW